MIHSFVKSMNNILNRHCFIKNIFDLTYCLTAFWMKNEERSHAFFFDAVIGISMAGIRINRLDFVNIISF